MPSPRRMHPLARARQARRWTRAALARRLGVPAARVRAWEEGALPPLAELQRLAEALRRGYRATLEEIVAWHAAAPGRAGAGATPAPRRLAARFNRRYDRCAGRLRPAVLAAYRAAYARLCPDDQRQFRARVIGHLARALAPLRPSALSDAGRVGDGWFPRPA